MDIKTWCEALKKEDQLEYYSRQDAKKIMDAATSVDGEAYVCLSEAVICSLEKESSWWFRNVNGSVTPSNVDKLFCFNKDLREITRCLLEKGFKVWIATEWCARYCISL